MVKPRLCRGTPQVRQFRECLCADWAIDLSSFPSCTWERECPRNFVASVQEAKHSFADKCVPKYNLGTRWEANRFERFTTPSLRLCRRLLTLTSYTFEGRS